MGTGTETSKSNTKPTHEIRSAVVRFAGDSGDGMQLAGTQFTTTSAVVGNDIATLPDYPAEIRAPVGTVAGVSGFQINFSSQDIHTPGDKVNALIAMNPAAFKAHIDDVEPGGIVIVNESEFEKVNLRKAGYDEGENPLDDPELNRKYQLFKVPITRLNNEALEVTELGAKDINRCKNMYALGIVYWLYDRPLDTTIAQINAYFGKKKNLPQVADANIAALKSGFYFGETAELFPTQYHVERATIEPGKYRKITGNEAVAMGLVAAAKLAGKDVCYCSYPITPASSVLHSLAGMRQYGVKTFQAEDEIAAVCAAIGASYAGQLGVTGTSGPGVALKGEAIGLAVMTELPLVVVNVQRGGPATGLPTKTEQSDLFQAIYGRNGECPAVVLAAKSPGDCFYAAIDACRIAMQRRVPVILLTDGYLGNGSEPWKIPDASSFEKIEIEHPSDPETFHAYDRDENLVRPWALPGTPGLEHRIGGLEKQNITGNVCYEPDNHQLMIEARKQKVEKIADDLPEQETYGNGGDELLVLGWGGTYGSILTAVTRACEAGKKVTGAHLRYLNPMPKNLGKLLKQYKRVLVPELNMGQLRTVIRGRYLVDARGLNKMQGRPFLVEEIEEAIDLMLADKYGDREYLRPHHGVVRLEDQEYDFTKIDGMPG